LFGVANTQVKGTSQFKGEICQAPFGGLGISAISSSQEAVERTDRHISQDRKDFYILVSVKSGSVAVTQNGRTCVVTSGQLVLFDADRPVVWMHDQPTNVLNVTLPRHLMDARIRNISKHCATTFPGSLGTWKIAATFLDSLNGQLRQISELAAHRYSSHVVDLVSLALETGADDIPMFSSPIRLPLYRRCAAYIRANLSDEDLDPGKIAEAMGISIRYLHRIFQDTDETVSDFVKNARLDACKADLCDKSRRNEPIAEIAYRHGFRSQSYFATAFKKRFGMSARESRKDADR
jgi:AraC-like DNA-binding protein